jgi:hypothetical protein
MNPKKRATNIVTVVFCDSVSIEKVNKAKNKMVNVGGINNVEISREILFEVNDFNYFF